MGPAVQTWWEEEVVRINWSSRSNININCYWYFSLKSPASQTGPMVAALQEEELHPWLEQLLLHWVRSAQPVPGVRQWRDVLWQLAGGLPHLLHQWRLHLWRPDWRLDWLLTADCISKVWQLESLKRFQLWDGRFGQWGQKVVMVTMTEYRLQSHHLLCQAGASPLRHYQPAGLFQQQHSLIGGTEVWRHLQMINNIVHCHKMMLIVEWHYFYLVCFIY